MYVKVCPISFSGNGELVALQTFWLKIPLCSTVRDGGSCILHFQSHRFPVPHCSMHWRKSQCLSLCTSPNQERINSKNCKEVCMGSKNQPLSVGEIHSVKEVLKVNYHNVRARRTSKLQLVQHERPEFININCRNTSDNKLMRDINLFLIFEIWELHCKSQKNKKIKCSEALINYYKSMIAGQ